MGAARLAALGVDALAAGLSAVGKAAFGRTGVDAAFLIGDAYDCTSSNDQHVHEREFATNDSGPSILLGPLGCCAALNRKDAPAGTA
ncbi:MAG: hypothetical protein ABIV47_11625 [Roseiflexaceae bacterium]